MRKGLSSLPLLVTGMLIYVSLESFLECQVTETLLQNFLKWKFLPSSLHQHPPATACPPNPNGSEGIDLGLGKSFNPFFSPSFCLLKRLFFHPLPLVQSSWTPLFGPGLALTEASWGDCLLLTDSKITQKTPSLGTTKACKRGQKCTCGLVNKTQLISQISLFRTIFLGLNFKNGFIDFKGMDT